MGAGYPVLIVTNRFFIASMILMATVREIKYCQPPASFGQADMRQSVLLLQAAKG